MIRASLVSVALLLASCHFSVADIAKVPDNPTWEADVKPYLADHCVLCHGSPPGRGAPGDFRLDIYDYDTAKDILGAKNMAPQIVSATKNDSMPPSAKWGDTLGPKGKAMLQKWLDNQMPQ